jgi:hypothetical protein
MFNIFYRVTLLPACLIVVAASTQHSATLRTADAAPQAMAPIRSALWQVDVDWSLALDPNSAALYAQMGTLVSGFPAVPNDRMNYYAAVSLPPDYVISGWAGLVTDVSPINNGGYVVTISVTPLLATIAYGDPTVVSTNYSEQFSVDGNNSVTYLGFLDPLGLSGQDPMVIGPPG